MPYLGNIPAENYASFDKQTITGDGGASYTLDNSVGNAQEVAIFVNNVRQEPGVAYTVAGTALTMTGNVSASDDFYAIFIGKAVQTVAIPEKATNGDYDFDGGTLFVDASANSIGVGTSSPSTSHKLTLDHTSNYGGISLKQSGTQVGQIIQEGGTGNVYVDADSGSAGGSLIFRTTGGTERARVTANGLTFNGDTAAANALDDYEEGTWSAEIQDSSGNASSSTAGTPFYTKIGRQVTVHCSFSNFNTTGLTAGNDLRIVGLPYIANGTTAGSIIVNYLATTSTDQTNSVFSYLSNNQSYVGIYETRRSSSGLISNVSAFSSGFADIFLTHTYFTD